MRVGVLLVHRVQDAEVPAVQDRAPSVHVEQAGVRVRVRVRVRMRVAHACVYACTRVCASVYVYRCVDASVLVMVLVLAWGSPLHVPGGLEDPLPPWQDCLAGCAVGLQVLQHSSVPCHHVPMQHRPFGMSKAGSRSERLMAPPWLNYVRQTALLPGHFAIRITLNDPPHSTSNRYLVPVLVKQGHSTIAVCLCGYINTLPSHTALPHCPPTLTRGPAWQGQGTIAVCLCGYINTLSSHTDPWSCLTRYDSRVSVWLHQHTALPH